MKNKSAIIPFRKRKKGTEILLIRNTDDDKWVIPKGTIEYPLDPLISATKEAFEEAGVLGRTHPIIVGRYYKNQQLVPTYLLEVDLELDDYTEVNRRKRIWVKSHQLAKFVFEKDLLQLLLTGLDCIEKNGAYFYHAIKTFCEPPKLEITRLNNYSAKIKYNIAPGRSKKLTVRRFKTNIEFWINSHVRYPEIKQIPKKLATNFLIENANDTVGFWCIRDRKKGFTISRMHYIELKLLNKVHFTNILKVLVENCLNFEEDLQRGIYHI